ncbi:MAG: HAD-IB family phosphatase [Gemmatimonadaceae bacterium]
MTATTTFRSILFDFDSTLSSLEGVEWIAARRGPEIAAAIAAEVAAAMDGTVDLEEVYAARMNRLRPSAQELSALAGAYRASIAPGAADTVRRLRNADVALRIVSGGFREAILPAAADLDFSPSDVHAVSVQVAHDGSYMAYDALSPLVTQLGKATVIATLDLPRPSLMVGDGATDAAARSAVDAFAAYTGFARRDAVTGIADHVVASYAELEALVFG